MRAMKLFVLLTVLHFSPLQSGWRRRKAPNSSARLSFPHLAIPRSRPSSSAAWRCCTLIGSRKRARCSTPWRSRIPIASWPTGGIAVNLLGNSLSGPPSAKDAQAAWDALERARAIGAKTQRERDWIEALSAYYRDYDKVSLDDRLLAYTKAMEQMTQRYPDDFEAWAYYALTLQASAPKTDKAYANQLKSAAILEKLFKQNPQHPGVSHYLIHAYDYPPLADKGIDAARRYAGIAPAAPHARHMPSHIYSMVGTVGGIDHIQPVGASSPEGLLSCNGLHGLCPPPARAGRQGQGPHR